MQDDKPRILVFGGRADQDHPVAAVMREHFDVEAFNSLSAAMEALRHETFHYVLADVGDFFPLERALVGDRASLVLNTIGEGVCVVDIDGRLVWSNKRMRTFAPRTTEQIRKICLQALSIFRSQTSRATDNSQTRSKKFTFQVEDRYFETICSPVVDADNEIQQVVAVVWDATSGKRLQSKIDAIDAAGRELAKIENEAVESLRPSERLKLLQDKIIHFSKDLMHFDHFAVRLLDRRTNKLEVVIAEGLPPEALEIDLYAQPEGNGISGYVAATGRSYICHDTEKDPRYVLGLTHCKSSLTVPLMMFDKVIGVYNIESVNVGAFDEDDRQFAEIFARYVALALHILDLLVVERYTTSGQITDTVLQQVTTPLNDILSEAESLKEEYIGDDTMRHRLTQIAENADQIRSTLDATKQGPNTVIGSQQVSDNCREQALCNRHVLVADDDPNIRKTIGEVLRKYGCEVTAAKDGYEACTLLEEHGPFDLIVSDIRMPYRNGYEVFATAQRCSAELPVLLMTGFGYDPHHSIVRASQEGLAGVLFKPFKVEQLMDEVRKALGCPEPAKS